MLFANYTCENSTELHYSIAEGIITIQCSLLCQHSSIFEQKPVLTSNKSSCPSSAVTHIWHYAVPCHWHNDVLADFFLQKFKQVISDGAGHDYRVDAPTLSIQNLCWSLWCIHVCLPALPQRNNT
jgi:hypothetical protein